MKSASSNSKNSALKTFISHFIVTTDHHRMQSMIEALLKLRIPHSPGNSLFFFTARDELRAADPLTHEWRDGNGRAVRLN